MSNNVRVIDKKSCTYYFFNDTVNIKHFDPNNIKIDEKPIFLFTILDMWQSNIQNT